LRDFCESAFAKKFGGGLFFGTVDRFQGRECDIVICSLVRKNKNGNIGFAKKPNRINVAFSRARRLLCIVGNSGQFCFESRDARNAYKKIYTLCNRGISESAISDAIQSDGIDTLAKKWSANVKK